MTLTLLPPTVLLTLPQTNLSFTHLRITEFEHFTTASAQDSLRQLPA